MAVIHFNLDPYTSEVKAAGTGTLFVLTTANYAPSTGIGRGQPAQAVLISVDSANVRFTLASGATPSTSCGHILYAGDYLMLDGYAQIANAKLFNEGGTATATCRITYFIS